MIWREKFSSTPFIIQAKFFDIFFDQHKITYVIFKNSIIFFFIFKENIKFNFFIIKFKENNNIFDINKNRSYNANRNIYFLIKKWRIL